MKIFIAMLLVILLVGIYVGVGISDDCLRIRGLR